MASIPRRIENDNRHGRASFNTITINEGSLRATLRSYFDYYHDSRCHLGLNKDSPEPRQIKLPDTGRIVEIPKVGGLHHRYDRRAA
jgi:putative transposase